MFDVRQLFSMHWHRNPECLHICFHNLNLWPPQPFWQNKSHVLNLTAREARECRRSTNCLYYRWKQNQVLFIHSNIQKALFSLVAGIGLVLYASGLWTWATHKLVLKDTTSQGNGERWETNQTITSCNKHSTEATVNDREGEIIVRFLSWLFKDLVQIKQMIKGKRTFQAEKSECE